MQTKRGSFAEAWANIAVGFSINFVANTILIPVFVGVHIAPGANFMMGCVYTLISLARSYVLRRWFNGLKFGHVPAVAYPTWLASPPTVLAEYECWLAANWNGSDDLRDLFIMTAGLAGETGEGCELLKKDIRGRPGQTLDRRKLCLELGDAHHYATRIAQRHGLTLADIQAANVSKLTHRRANGKNEAAELELCGAIIGESARAAA